MSGSAVDSTHHPETGSEKDDLSTLNTQLAAASPQKQLPILQELFAAGDPGWRMLLDFLRQTDPDVGPTIATGKAYQLLRTAESDQIQAALDQHWPIGIVETPSSQSINYDELQQYLVKQDYEKADRITLQKLCELAGPGAVQRKWVYFTEVESFPNLDLHTLDQLWLVYSEGKFGFSKQRAVWLNSGQDWERVWEKIAWKSGNTWTRYPGGFIWDLSAPVGHLPLSNQLRGVRFMSALINHPAWS